MRKSSNSTISCLSASFYSQKKTIVRKPVESEMTAQCDVYSITQ